MNERVLLIDVDSHNFPNLVLMKLSAYHKAEGDKVNFIKLTPEDKKLILTGQPMWFDGEYDRIYAACVFTENEKIALNLRNMGARVGGTGVIRVMNFGGGYGFQQILSPEQENIYPDYELYGDEFKDTAYGFLTRGCPRECPFCIVSRKEGRYAYKVADLQYFYKDQNVIKLLDPNILAYKDHMELLEQLVDSGAWIDFTQGLDARLITASNLTLIQKMKVKMLHFAYDNPRNRRIKDYFYFIRENLNLPSRKMRVYVLTNFWSTFDEDLERIYWLRDNGFDPYVMIYDKEHAPKEIKKLQRYVNCKWIFHSIDKFEDYVPIKWKRHLEMMVNTKKCLK